MSLEPHVFAQLLDNHLRNFYLRFQREPEITRERQEEIFKNMVFVVSRFLAAAIIDITIPGISGDDPDFPAYRIELSEMIDAGLYDTMKHLEEILHFRTDIQLGEFLYFLEIVDHGRANAERNG